MRRIITENTNQSENNWHDSLFNIRISRNKRVKAFSPIWWIIIVSPAFISYGIFEIISLILRSFS